MDERGLLPRQRELDGEMRNPRDIQIIWDVACEAYGWPRGSMHSHDATRLADVVRMLHQKNRTWVKRWKYLEDIGLLPFQAVQGMEKRFPFETSEKENDKQESSELLQLAEMVGEYRREAERAKRLHKEDIERWNLVGEELERTKAEVERLRGELEAMTDTKTWDAGWSAGRERGRAEGIAAERARTAGVLSEEAVRFSQNRNVREYLPELTKRIAPDPAPSAPPVDEGPRTGRRISIDEAEQVISPRPGVLQSKGVVTREEFDRLAAAHETLRVAVEQFGESILSEATKEASR